MYDNDVNLIALSPINYQLDLQFTYQDVHSAHCAIFYLSPIDWFNRLIEFIIIKCLFVWIIFYERMTEEITRTLSVSVLHRNRRLLVLPFLPFLFRHLLNLPYHWPVVVRKETVAYFVPLIISPIPSLSSVCVCVFVIHTGYSMLHLHPRFQMSTHTLLISLFLLKSYQESPVWPALPPAVSLPQRNNSSSFLCVSCYDLLFTHTLFHLTRTELVYETGSNTTGQNPVLSSIHSMIDIILSFTAVWLACCVLPTYLILSSLFDLIHTLLSVLYPFTGKGCSIATSLFIKIYGHT